MNGQPTVADTTSVQNWLQAEAEGLYSLAILFGLTFPGALIGAVLAGALWQGAGSPVARRIVMAGSGVCAFAVMHGPHIAWFWGFVVALVRAGPVGTSASQLLAEATPEILLGPLLLLTFQIAGDFRMRTALGLVDDEHERMSRRAKAMRLGYQGPNSPTSDEGDWDHPPGKIRLGLSDRHQLFDLDIAEIAHHVFIPGATGTGKTTTLMRLAGGALSNGYGVIVIDCKGVGLAPAAKQLAEKFHVPFNVVDPDEARSLGYDTCTGDPSHVANKLVGSFSFSADAEIFKNIAMEIVPVIARGLLAANQKVTLRAIYNALAKGGLAKLGRLIPADHPLIDRLKTLEQAGGVAAAGRIGLQNRLGALLEGKFGTLFEKTPALDWTKVTRAPAITYFSLSATAASEDVELFGRVITQDLKQLCDTRLRMQRAGEPLVPTLIIYDEFAALKEARQIVDLLLQARQAEMPVVVATQYLPEDIPIRTPVLQAGTLICHRVAAEDAEAIAAQIGTRDVPRVTSQIDYESGLSEKGSVRMVKEYRIHPDTLKELQTGVAAVYAQRSQRRDLVHIHLDQS